MAIGRKLMLLGCYAFGVAALLLVCIAAPGIVSLVNSGQQLCVPGLSIRCHESDCGRSYQRCGMIAILEVPADKVCYRGALQPARRTDLHSCISNTVSSSNSSLPQSGIGACDCATGCKSYPNTCECMCQSGPRATVQCTNPLKTYPNDAVARCCLQKKYGKTSKCSAVRTPVWQLALETVRQLFTDSFGGRWSLQDTAAIFTFQQPLSVSSGCVCYPGGACGSVCQ